MGVSAFDGVSIDPRIERARTLPGRAYHHAAWFQAQTEYVFGRSWHLWPLDARPEAAGYVAPWNLLPGVLDEPLLLTHDGAELRCISNVCTHRGKVLVERPGKANSIRCGYHGRRFALSGSVTAAPGFEHVEGFPCPADHLQAVPFSQWQRFLFASLDPAHSLDALLEPLRARIGGLMPEAMQFDPERSRQYDVDANWALYVDNYLEGFHIPFVHPSLNQVLEFDAYRTETFALGSVQIGIAADDESAFALPKSHPDHGQRVAAYYFWLYPGTMFNVYPWGLSVNVIQPQGPHRTRVVYLRYVWDESKLDQGAGAGLDEVEYEDEIVVASCARGTRSRLYDRGRYAPDREVGVHHFHRLMIAALANDPAA